ncbi:MAG: sulfite oxidase [Planctomycetaceae bacterium]|nr:MAG: sulfite oxidase [Planctomycetaceae bacterium]
MNSEAGLNRREALQQSALWGAGWLTWPTWPAAWGTLADDETLVPFLDMPRARPGILDWETLDSWLTPQDQVFEVSHYGVPRLDPTAYRLEITGLVRTERHLTLEELQSLPVDEQWMTLECSGNGASKGFLGAVYNSRWKGTRLVPLLKQCGWLPQATEVVFIGYDEQQETLRKGTPREITFPVPFGRSMSLQDVLKHDPLLAYERNGQPLTPGNGAPLRLIVPGWYGIANVKWLRRIELRDRRYMGRFMARDYVTVRGERRGDEVVYVETSITRMNLKSIIARVTRRPAREDKIPCTVYGAAWSDGTPIRTVEIQVDDGPWRPAVLQPEPQAPYCWTFFSLDVGPLTPGKHRLISRAVDINGKIQPTADDDEIALKKTYWEAYAQWPRDIELML